MHPRQLTHLQVSDEQLEQAVEAAAWFISALLRVFSLIHEKQAVDAGKPHVPLPGLDQFQDLIAERLGEKQSPRNKGG